MAKTHIHVRVDDDAKQQAQLILSDMGLDLSTAVNIFIKQIVRNRSFPFLPSADPFYDESNMAHLMNVNVKADTDAGSNMVIHELKEEKRKLKAYGSFSEYADPVKIASEKEAWPAAAVEKHDNS